jgi:hypothetical protein
VGGDHPGKTWHVEGHTEGLAEGLAEPLTARMRALLRRAVHEYAAGERRRAGCPPVLHVGVPGGPAVSLDLSTAEPTDPGLRTDVVAALRVRAGGVSGGPGETGALVWLTRAGGLELQDVDARWLAGARAAYDEAQVPLTFVVVTRRGWRDPRSGLGRSWARVRPLTTA